MTFQISIDTGGTFSDVVVVDDTGALVVAKSLTTPARIFSGMKAALEVAATTLNMDLQSLLNRTDLLIYGTTRSVNAVVEGKVAKTAFLTTKGFPDVLVFREGGKSNPYEFGIDYPPPYIPRHCTFEIDERVSSEGDLVRSLNTSQVCEILRILKESQFEAIAVCFLWSIANPNNELAIGELIEEFLPGVPYTLSHRLIPIVREYRRASASAIDASLKPLMQRHLREMEEDLRAAGYAGEILISTSIGGCMHIDELATKPILTIKSGPAMAPVAGRACARMERVGSDVIVCDTGGTTFDVGLVRNDQLVYTRETWIGPRWTGHIVSMSTVDVRSVGAGGGSVAWIDSGGLLRVGPRSAGADPGPACYGRGGNQPTVTDAALLLGYLDPQYFLGGRIPLDGDAAKSVIDELADKIRQPLEKTAFAILAVTNEHMIKAIQEITINEGFDPRESTLVAGGGAAGINILAIGQELGCRTIIVPKSAGALSACGMQYSDVLFEHSVSCLTLSNNFDKQGVNAALDDIDNEIQRFIETLVSKGFTDYVINYIVEARYLFQMWELEVPLSVRRFDDEVGLGKLVGEFHRTHDRVFAVTDLDCPIECLVWKGRVTVRVGKTYYKSRCSEVHRVRMTEPIKSRPAFFGEDGWMDTPVYLGHSIPKEVDIEGPAIIEEPTTTIVVYPSMMTKLSKYDNYVTTLR